MPAPFEVAGHVENRVLVHVTLNNTVDLDRSQTSIGRDINGLQDGANRKADVIHLLEGGVVHGVETHGHPVQASVGQCRRLAGQQRGVGGEGEVLHPIHQGDHPDQVVDPFAQQWFPPSDPDLVDPAGDEGPNNRDDLLEGEKLISWQEHVVGSEDLLGHAVGAPEVATVSDRDPQVPDRSVEEIGNPRHRLITISRKYDNVFEVVSMPTENMAMGIFKRRHKATQIGSTAEFEELLRQGKPVLVDFMKYGCQPCQVMDGIVNEVSEEFEHEAIVIKANLEKVPDLFHKFKVRSTPTFVLLAPQGNGLHQRWRHSGLVKKDVMVTNVSRAVEKGLTY